MSSILDTIKAFWRFGDAITSATIADTTGRGNDLTRFVYLSPCTIKFRMGANGNPTPGQQATASLKGWGRWNRLLTSGEKAALAGGEYWPFSTTTTLQDAKVYYLLDESGGSTTYADATSRGNDLAATGTTSQVTGPNGGADKGTAVASGIYLTKTSPGADLQSGPLTYTIAGWVNLASKSGSQQVFWGQLDSHVSEAATVSGTNVYYDSTSDRFCLDVDGGDSRTLTSGSLVIDSVLGSPSTSTWYFLICEVDLTNNRSTISVNNGTATTLSGVIQPTVASGQVGNASQFFANPAASFSTRTSGWDYNGDIPINGNSNVSIATNADVAFGNNAKTVWGWIKATDHSTYQTVGGIYAADANHTDWIIQIVGNKLYFVFGKEQAFVTANLTDTNWHLFVAWFDKAGNKIYIDFDHGAQTANATGPATPQTIATPFAIGADQGHTNGHTDNQYTGLVNAWGIADGTPSQADLDALWNSGDGWTLVAATLDQSTAITGSTVTGTYANYTPDHVFAVTGQMSPATIALTNFSAADNVWQADVPDTLIGTDYEYFLNDSDNSNSVDLGQLQVTAALSTAYVRTDGSDSNDGSANDSGHAFSTLAHAVSVLSSGGSINIDEGSYDTTTIDATSLDDVTLTGRGSGLVNLVQTGTGAILDITGTTGWTISGINFDASADASTGWTVKADSTTNCTIDSCTGIGPEDGIVATNSVNIRVTNCTWNGYYDGANFTGSINPYFYNTTFATNSTIALVVDCHGAILDSIVGGLAVNCTFTGARAAASTKRTIGALVGGASMTLSGCAVNASSSHSASTGAVVGLDDLTGGTVSKRLSISGTTFTTSAADTSAAVLDIFNGLGVVIDNGGNTYSANKTIGPIRVAGNSVTEGWSIAGDYADWVSPISGEITGVLLGAGGGTGSSSTGEGAGGGGARIDFTLNVVAGQKISIHVGSGGSINADGDYSYIFDGTGWNVLGTDVSTTYFAGFGHKGSSGAGGAGGSDNGSSGTAHNGGAGGNGSSTDGGGGGGSGKSNATGGNGNAGGVSGNAGGAGTWAGGTGGTTGAAGYNGLGPGAGGGGGGNAANGGLGQAGQVLLSYTAIGFSLGSKIASQQLIGMFDPA